MGDAFSGMLDSNIATTLITSKHLMYKLMAYIKTDDSPGITLSFKAKDIKPASVTLSVK